MKTSVVGQVVISQGGSGSVGGLVDIYQTRVD